MCTLDYQASLSDPTVDPAHPGFQGPAIFIFWHEYIPMPIFLRGHCNIGMLVSKHGDAEWLSQSAYHMGFTTIRGSTYRGAGAALRELCHRGRTMNLAMTPDGPRGPRRKLAQGPIYLASRLQLPLILMGFGYDRPWRLGTWDRFAVPRPYSRARLVIRPRITIPANLDRTEVERHRLLVEAQLNVVNEEAEAWALSGARRAGQKTLVRQAAPLLRNSIAAPPMTTMLEPHSPIASLQDDAKVA